MRKRGVAKRRGQGEDSIYQRADGTWVGVIELARQSNGRRNRKVVKAQDKKTLLARLEEARKLVAAGVTTPAGTVGAFLTEWLDTVIAARVGENTESNYRAMVDAHLIPGLGRIRLTKLTADQVDRFLADKAQGTNGKAYSRSMVTRMRTILIDALNHAERRGMVPRNVAALSVMPKTKPATPRQSFTPEQVNALMAAAEGDRLEALVVVGLYLALRPGELTGLLWADIALGHATLAVTGSIKRRPDNTCFRGDVKRSTAPERTIRIPPVVVQALREHRTRQKAERLAAGPDWEDHGLVFPTTIGTPLDPSNVRRTFARIGKKAGIEGAIPYLLRHTGVSLLIDNGATIEEVADLTGSDPRTLYRHYRHRVRPVVTVAAERMDSILG
jgi:integrase